MVLFKSVFAESSEYQMKIQICIMQVISSDEQCSWHQVFTKHLLLKLSPKETSELTVIKMLVLKRLGIN